MKQKLDKKVNLNYFINRTIFSLFAYVPLIIFSVLDEAIIGGSIVKIALIILFSIISLLAFIPNFITVFFVYKYHSYEMKSNCVIINTGIIARSEAIVPYKRIQHIEKVQGPVQLLLGLASIQIYTAGSVQTIIGINNITANVLLNELKDIANLYIQEDLGDD